MNSQSRFPSLETVAERVRELEADASPFTVRAYLRPLHDELVGAQVLDGDGSSETVVLWLWVKRKLEDVEEELRGWAHRRAAGISRAEAVALNEDKTARPQAWRQSEAQEEQLLHTLLDAAGCNADHPERYAEPLGVFFSIAAMGATAEAIREEAETARERDQDETSSTAAARRELLEAVCRTAGSIADPLARTAYLKETIARYRDLCVEIAPASPDAIPERIQLFPRLVEGLRAILERGVLETLEAPAVPRGRSYHGNAVWKPYEQWIREQYEEIKSSHPELKRSARDRMLKDRFEEVHGHEVKHRPLSEQAIRRARDELQ